MPYIWIAVSICHVCMYAREAQVCVFDWMELDDEFSSKVCVFLITSFRFDYEVAIKGRGRPTRVAASQDVQSFLRSHSRIEESVINL